MIQQLNIASFLLSHLCVLFHHIVTAHGALELAVAVAGLCTRVIEGAYLMHPLVAEVALHPGLADQGIVLLFHKHILFDDAIANRILPVFGELLVAVGAPDEVVA